MDSINLGTQIAMVLTEAPLGITLGRKHFFLYPQTLGKMYLTSQIVETIGIDKENIKANAIMEALRVVGAHREDCCQLIAYHTFQKKSDLLNTRKIKNRAKEIADSGDNEDIASILLIILSDNQTNDIIHKTGIDKEAERMSRISQAKDSKNSFIFGGKTIWGSVIDAACERYGWTFEYVLWGISYCNLTLMLKDKVTSVFVSDEERKKAHIPAANERVFDGNNKEDIMRMIRESEEHPI